MNLEQQVVSLSLAKRLKELGVKQESIFAWCQNPAPQDEYYLADQIWTDDHDHLRDKVAAFTVAELGEFFRKVPYLQVIWMPAWKEDGTQSLAKLVNGETGERVCDTTGEADKLWEAEARGLMLAYLLENQLISL